MYFVPLLFFIIIINQVNSLQNSLMYTSDQYECRIPNYSDMVFLISAEPQNFPCFHRSQNSLRECYTHALNEWGSIGNRPRSCCCFYHYLRNCLENECTRYEWDRERPMFNRLIRTWISDRCPEYDHFSDCWLTNWAISTIVLAVVTFIILVVCLAFAFRLGRRRNHSEVKRPVSSA